MRNTVGKKYVINGGFCQRKKMKYASVSAFLSDNIWDVTELCHEQNVINDIKNNALLMKGWSNQFRSIYYSRKIQFSLTFFYLLLILNFSMHGNNVSKNLSFLKTNLEFFAFVVCNIYHSWSNINFSPLRHVDHNLMQIK